MPKLDMRDATNAAARRSDAEVGGDAAYLAPPQPEARRQFVELLLRIPDVGRDEDFDRIESSTGPDDVFDRYQRH